MEGGDEDYNKGDAGSADTVPTQAGSIKKGGYVMLKGFPCKVTEYSTAKPGKHGSAKATIVGVDIFTGKKHQDSCPTSHNMQVPLVTKKELEAADIDDDDFVTLILPDGTLKQDLKLPADEELRNELYNSWKTNCDSGHIYFTVISACGQEKIVATRIKEGN